MDRRVEDVEEEEGRRPRSGSKQFYNILVIFFILLEPLSNVMRYFTNHIRHFLGLFMQWVQIHVGTSGQQVSSRYNCKVESKDLILGRFLGQGCSGIFYETTWSGSYEKTVKLARKLFPGVKGDVFESEVVRLLELNDHPNVVKNLCWTVDNKSCSLVMEYVRDNLPSVMQKKKDSLRKEAASKQLETVASPAPFQLPEALDIVLQIAMGIRYLHGEGMYHGDLNASNVLTDWEEGRMLVKLTDFGLIETKRRTTLISQRALCSKTIKWSAPELFENYFGSMSEDLDYLGTEPDMATSSEVSYDKKRREILMEKADSYTFALTCVFVFVGKLWSPNLSPNELRKHILSSGLRPKLPPECPVTLASLILLCWDAEPLRRPTFSVICDKLEEIITEQREQKTRREQGTSNIHRESVENFERNAPLETLVKRTLSLRGPRIVRSMGGVIQSRNGKTFVTNIRPSKWNEKNKPSQFWIGKIHDLQLAQYYADTIYHYCGKPRYHFKGADLEFPPLECIGTDINTPVLLTTMEMRFNYVRSICGKGFALQREDFIQKVMKVMESTDFIRQGERLLNSREEDAAPDREEAASSQAGAVGLQARAAALEARAAVPQAGAAAPQPEVDVPGEEDEDDDEELFFSLRNDLSFSLEKLYSNTVVLGSTVESIGIYIANFVKRIMYSR